ncbi:MAG: hypothetical protein ACI4TX_03365 [Christensenellales bacterium]
MIKSLEIKRQAKALRHLEDELSINLDCKFNKWLKVGASAVIGSVALATYNNIFAIFVPLGALCLYKGIEDNKKRYQKNAYNIAYKYNTYDKYDKMNGFVLLNKIKKDLESKNIFLSYDEIDCFIREIVFNNFMLLKKEKSQKEIKKSNKITRKNYANLSLEK